jgi:hypothetical protein
MVGDVDGDVDVDETYARYQRAACGWVVQGGGGGSTACAIPAGAMILQGSLTRRVR